MKKVYEKYYNLLFEEMERGVIVHNRVWWALKEAIKETRKQTIKEVLELIDKKVKKNEREYKDFCKDFWVDLQKNNIPDHTLLKRDNELFSRIGSDISEGSLADVEVVVFDDLKKEIKKLDND